MSETPTFDILSSFDHNDLIQDPPHPSNNNNTHQQTDDLLNEFLDSRIYDHGRINKDDEDSLRQNLNYDLQAKDMNGGFPDINNSSISNNNNNNNNGNGNNDLIHSLLSQNFLENSANSANSQEEDYIFKVNSSNESNNSIVPPETPPSERVDTTSYQMIDQNLQDMDVDYGFNKYFDTSNLTDIQSKEFHQYEESRKELMKLKFGGPPNSQNGVLGTTIPSQVKLEGDEQQDDYQIPEAYFDTSKDDQLPYKLQISGLPDHSRVETQIKISLSVSPPPPQFLLQLPSDTISKTKLRLAEDVPESSKKHILYLDTYVLTSGDNDRGSSKKKNGTTPINSPASDSSSPTAAEGEKQPSKLNHSMKNCNICTRCVRRELKRASRRKNGTLEDAFNWNLMGPKRAVIFNCKEIISFPPPTVASGLANKSNRDELDDYINTDEPKAEQFENEKRIEMSTRIICYCRHHFESKGFRLFFVLKNYDGEILGKTFSSPIMIMDRKKSIASSSEKNPGASTDIKKEHPLSPTSLDESSSEQTGVSDYSRPSKRKRGWSPSIGSGSTSTYYDSVSQRRTASSVGLATANNNNNNNNHTFKREPLSSTESEAQRSPNVFHNLTVTPERTASITSVTSNTSSYAASKNNNNSSIGLAQTHALATAAPAAAAVPSAPPSNQPSIQRIIPAQGPIRGGIEVTLLGSNFRPGLVVKFGANQALTTHCWSDSTIVTYLPPASNPGQVLVTFENAGDSDTSKIPPQQVFTYTDDTDRQLIELALQIVGLKMNGKLEDAKNIAKRIIGNSNDTSNAVSPSSTAATSGATQMSADWFSTATETVKQLSQSSSNTEEVLLKFLSLLDLPNAPIMTPNWAVCTIEGQTLLHLAAIRDHYKLVLYLIKRGSRVDYRDVNDFTPLHFALMNGNREIIEVLMRCGANWQSKIRNKIALDKISNSNVLDLLVVEEMAESTIEDVRSHTRRSSTDSISSMFNDIDDGLRQHVSRIVDDYYSPVSDISLDDDNNDAASEEIDEFADESETSSIVDDEFDSEAESVTERELDGAETETETIVDHESLPNYDDLFPSSSSLKSLLKSFSSGSKISKQQQQEQQVSEEGSSSDLEESSAAVATVEPTDDKILKFFLNNSTRTTPVMRDAMLFFFWLPLLLITVVLVVGFNEQLAFEAQFHKFNDFLRQKLAHFMLGRDRVEGMIHSVNAAVTAGLNNMSR